MADFKESIKKNRFHQFLVKTSWKEQAVSVRQINHKFLFGSNIFGLTILKDERLQQYQERISEIWNAGTLPFYWEGYESSEGNPDPENRVMKAAVQAKKDGFYLKGHPLCWHTLAPSWLMEYSNDRILGKVLDRIRRDVSLYKGIIDCWDVINEVVILPVFDKYDNAITRLANYMGAENLVLECFKAVREVNSEATLLINDFDLSPDYERLIESLLEKGCSIDAIGLQTHQHTGYHPPEKVADFLDRFSRFGKPLHFTEITILSGKKAPPVEDLNDIHWDEWPSTPEGEEQQKQQTEEFYSQIYSHPSTEALIWWDIEDGNWLNAPAGLLRKDLSPKPAFKRLKELIKQEWAYPQQEQMTDGKGNFIITGPEGEYELEKEGKKYRFSLTKEIKSYTVEPFNA